MVFRNIHKVLFVEDLYPNVDSQNNSNNASDTSWDKKKYGSQDDHKNILYYDEMEYDEIDDLNKDFLHLHNGLGDNINDANNKLQYIEEGEILNEDKGQRNKYTNTKNIPLANNIPLAQNEHFGGANDKENNNENPNHDRNNHNPVSKDGGGDSESYDDYNNSGDKSENNHETNNYPEDEVDNDDNIAESEDDDQDTNDVDQPKEVTGQVKRRNRHSIH